MAQISDPFAVLGVSPSASEDEIKSAYRKLAKKYHPDLNPGDKAAEAKMREVNEAYTQALQIKKNGGSWNPGSSGSGPYGSSYSGPGGAGGYGTYGGTRGYGSQGNAGYGRSGGSGGNPFEDFGFGFGFDPFGFGSQSRTSGTAFRPRSLAMPLTTCGQQTTHSTTRRSMIAAVPVSACFASCYVIEVGSISGLSTVQLAVAAVAGGVALDARGSVGDLYRV